MTKLKRNIRGALLLAVLGACGESVPETNGFRHSIGVLAPTLTIDGHASTLTSISRVAVGPDGTIALLQPREARVRFFSREGTDLGSFGQRGAGPGHFGYPNQLGWVGDSLWIHDNGKISYITSRTNLARIQNVVSSSAPLRTTSEGAMLHPELVDQTPLAVHAGGALGLPARRADDLVIGLVDTTGTLRNSLLLLPQDEGVQIRVGGVVLPLPFSSLPSFAAAADGSRYALVVGSTRGPDAGTFQATIVSSEGDTLVSRRYAAESEVISGQAADSVIDAAIESHEMPGVGEAIRSRTVVPDVFPFVSGIMFGSDYSLWVAHRMTNGRTRYYVMGEDGSPEGSFLLPSSGRGVWAEPEAIWVVEYDDLGVESLVRYAVSWQRGE